MMHSILLPCDDGVSGETSPLFPPRAPRMVALAGGVMLEPLGLDIVTEKVYRSLLEQSAWGVTEICAHLGLTESGVRDALDRLTELRLVTASGPGGTVRPVQPRFGLIALLARTEANLIDRQRQIEAARAAVAALASDYQ